MSNLRNSPDALSNLRVKGHITRMLPEGGGASGSSRRVTVGFADRAVEGWGSEFGEGPL